MSKEQKRRGVYDALDGMNTRVAWLKSVSQLIMSQAELSDAHQMSFLNKEDWGNTGWLMNNLLDEVDGLINTCFNKLKEVSDERSTEEKIK